jgi:hypothetical protein
MESQKEINNEGVYEKYTSSNLINLLEFNYFFWIKFQKDLFNRIYAEIKDSKYAKEDLFSSLYQEVFLPDTRHKRGEFFTPSKLVKKMVNNTYEIGYKILDPSCGSGNFLVHIVLKILDSSESTPSKTNAISKIFGFDINPLAIMTTRINILLLVLEYFEVENSNMLKNNIFLIDSLFPEHNDDKNLDIRKLYNSFDLIIGNPPWLTYKDLHVRDYQIKVRELSEKLGIKPTSQYITHIELAAVFFYALPLKFLKKNGIIFFVMPKSVLNGDHCYRFRAFSLFSKNLEIWDFPKNYFFNVNHICLKAEYIGKSKKNLIHEKYPIKTKIFDDKLQFQEEITYNSLKIEANGAKLILPDHELKNLNNPKESPYKDKFFQGATLVPRSLVFFEVEEKRNENIIISSDMDVLSRVKKKWEYRFQKKEIERIFRFKTFLNKDLIPFFIKRKKNVFLPVNKDFEYNFEFLRRYPRALEFYEEINAFYKKNKKKTSTIETLFANLNYWNKLKKQINNTSYIIAYNASGSGLKAAVINNEKQKIIVGSENYYYSTNSESEAYFLSSILNSPILSRNIKIIKSSRHIHKRPFTFPIPIYDKTNLHHNELAKLGKKCENVVQDLYLNNPKIISEKVRIIINQRLLKIDKLTEEIIFN